MSEVWNASSTPEGRALGAVDRAGDDEVLDLVRTVRQANDGRLVDDVLELLVEHSPVNEPVRLKYHSAVRSIWLERMGLSIGLPAAEPVRVTLVTLVTPEFWSVVPAKSWFSVVCACNWLKSGREMPVPSAKRYCSSLLLPAQVQAGQGIGVGVGVVLGLAEVLDDRDRDPVVLGGMALPV